MRAMPTVRRLSPRLVVLLMLVLSLARGQKAESLFPEVEGWRLSVDEIVYKPDNLWDAIDGAADLFLEYNFSDLHIGRYVREPDLEIKVELYRHATAIDAFGMYSQERYPDYHFLMLGVQGYAEKGVLNFLTGEYYVKLSSVQSGKVVDEGLVAIAGQVEAHLKQTNTWPALLAAFPEHGKKPQSEQYVSRSFLGYSFFNRAFVSSYEDETAFKVFVIDGETADAAKGIIETYGESLPQGALTSVGGGTFEVQDPHNGRIELVLHGRYVCGVIGGEEKKPRKNYLQEIIGNISTAK